MKKLAWMLGAAVILVLIALILTRNPGEYHLRQFENIKTNFNNHSPTVLDRVRGIRDNQEKWDFHLRRLEELGVVEHRRFVFSEVPYTAEAARRIWRSAVTNFPNAIMFTAAHHDTNALSYGVEPYVLNVWDRPEATRQWTSFFEANNRRQ
jgi:hypothetical protein